MSSSDRLFDDGFEGRLRGWTVNHVSRNYWRVESTMERDDVMQESYLTFLKVKARYAGVVDEPAHFMALYKTAWTRRFTDLANADTARRVEISSDRSGPDGEARTSVEELTAGETDNDGRLAVLLRQAPREVMQVVNLFLSCPQEILDLALQSWQGDRRRSDTSSRKVCQLLGLPGGRDVIAETIDYFTGP